MIGMKLILAIIKESDITGWSWDNNSQDNNIRQVIQLQWL